ncbi:MAG: IS5 family transposase [Nitrososphaerales archaeon]
MAEIRRWGKKYVDKRNWKEYNESLVRRGEVLLDFDLLDEWKEELKKANDGKEGASFRYPEPFMRLLAYLHVLFHLPFRQEEGFIRSLSKHVPGLEAPVYSTIWERTKDLDMTLDGVKTNEPISIAVDSSGIKVSNSGDWMRKKWKVKRGYLKIHLAVDSRSKQAVSMQVTEETVSDGSQTEPLVKEAMSKNDVERVYGDGAYDSRANFNLLASNGIDPAIKVRKNASRKAKGSYARKASVIAQQTDFEAWKKEKTYGDRWAVEGAYSVLKRVFGEYVSAKKFVNMAKEMTTKVSLYNLFMQMTPHGGG